MNNVRKETKRQVPARWKWLNIIDYLLPLYILCTIPLFYFGVHYDFVFKGLTILITLLYIVRFGYPQTQETLLFTLFLLLVTLSCFQYIYNGIPIICYFNDASNYIAAMLFFYVGVSDNRPGRLFYRRLLHAVIIVFVLGLACYVLTPYWYVSRYIEIVNARTMLEYNEVNILNDLRFSAFFGDSYPVSHLSVFAAAIAIFDVGYNKGRHRILPIIFLLISIAASVASMHRASIIGCAICIVMFVYFNQKRNQKSTFVTIIVLGILAIISFIVLLPSMNERVSGIMDLVTQRVDENMNLGKALDERKNTRELMSSMRFFVLGHGLGSGGAFARQRGLLGVSDMQYIKMFFENGLVGAFFFIFIIVRSLTRGLRHIIIYLTEVSIVLFILVAMLGSNSLSIYYFIVYPFWYAVGRMCNNSYLNSVKNKEWMY